MANNSVDKINTRNFSMILLSRLETQQSKVYSPKITIFAMIENDICFISGESIAYN